MNIIMEQITHDEESPTIEDYVKETQHLFYVDWDWTQKGELDALFKLYFTRFVCGYEISNVNAVKHLQCFTIGPPARYRAFVARWKIDYEKKHGKKPTGRAKKGGRKNYGKVRNIKKPVVNCIAYCIKDGEYSHFNFPKETMLEAEKTTYKVENIDTKKLIIKHFLKRNKDLWHYGSHDDKFNIITKLCKFHFEAFNHGMSKSTLTRYLLTSGLISHRDYAKQFKMCVYEYELQTD